MAKYRSIDTEYVHQIIKEYTHWTLSIHDDQHFLGRCYVWLVREGEMQRLSQLTSDEVEELRVVLKEYEAAVGALWQPDHMNYSWLGNFFHEHGGHGHMHLVPRYKDARSFDGKEFIDGKWGQNFTPHEPLKLKEEELLAIREAIQNAI